MNADEVQLTVDEAVALTAAHAKGAAEVGRVVRGMIAARTAEAPAPTDAREALARVEAVAAAWESDRDVCLRWIADPTMHVDPDHPARLSRMADLLNRHAESVRAAAALAPTAPDAGQEDRRAREAEHGTWDKEQQRYADGCKADAPPHAPDAGQDAATTYGIHLDPPRTSDAGQRGTQECAASGAVCGCTQTHARVNP